MEIQKWASLDTAGVMESHGEVPYLAKGLSGRCIAGNSLGWHDVNSGLVFFKVAQLGH